LDRRTWIDATTLPLRLEETRMRIIKKAIKKALAAMGYEVRSRTQQTVSLRNFQSLAQAYELRLNESQNAIVANEMRAELLGRLLGTPPSEAYFIVQALAQSQRVQGDVCEFGVAQGETSALLANEIRSRKATLHLFDSFEGLPEPTEKDSLKDDIFGLGSMEAYSGTMSCKEDMVRARLRSISFPTERVAVHKGFIEQVLQNDRRLPSKVSFAYVDLDFYAPIKAALEFLHEVTSPGSITVVDDYDFFSTGAKTAVDEFISVMNSTVKRYECVVPDRRYGCFAILTRTGT
jgi:O-methyltransferase